MTAGISAVTYKLNLPFLNLATGRGYSAFFLGMLFYYINQTVSKKFLVIYSVLCFLGCSVAAGLRSGIDDQWGIFTFMIWPSVLIIFLLCEPIFRWRGFSFLGAVSFEMYLWHIPFIFLVEVIKRLMGQINYSNSEIIGFIVLVIFISFCMLKIETGVICYFKKKMEYNLR